MIAACTESAICHNIILDYFLAWPGKQSSSTGVAQQCVT